MPRRGENIHKRTDGRWEGRYIDHRKSDGSPHYKSIYAPTYGEVRAKMSQMKAVPAVQRQMTSLVTMEQLSFLWLEHKKVQIKESTFARYTQVLSGHIASYFRGVKVCTLTNEDVTQFVKDKLAHGRLDGKGGLSAKSVCDILSLLLQIVQYGEKKGAIASFDYDISRPKQDIAELVILSQSEQERLLHHLKAELDHKKLGILLAFYTGIRLGEVCSLQWQDIDFESGVLRVNKTLQRIQNTEASGTAKTKMVITPPKSKKSVREIPLPGNLLHILKQFRQSGSVYIVSNSAKYIDPRVYQDKFKQYLQQANIQSVHFHALRHTFATRAIEQKFDYKTLSELLGHSSVRFTLERYVHSSLETKRASMEQFAACF